MWTVDGERVIVSVLYAANQALPLYSAEVACVLGKFHKSVIQEDGSNVTLATSMVFILPTAVVRIDLNVPCTTGAGAEPELAATKFTWDIPVTPVDR